MTNNHYRLDDSLGYKLFHASRLINNQLKRNFQNLNHPITEEQWQIISRLYDHDGLTQNQLAEKNERDQAGISRLIDNLIKNGYVTRETLPGDKRVRIIRLTQKSREIQHELTQMALNTITKASHTISEQDLAITLNVLDQIRHNLK